LRVSEKSFGSTYARKIESKKSHEEQFVPISADICRYLQVSADICADIWSRQQIDRNCDVLPIVEDSIETDDGQTLN
jgi:hypothetical protein